MNTNDAEIIEGLRDENRVLSDTLEVLTVELAKCKAGINSHETIVEATTPVTISPFLRTIEFSQPANQMEAKTNENVDEAVTTFQVAAASPPFDEQLLEYKQAQKNRLRAQNSSRSTSLHFDVQRREYMHEHIQKASLKRSTKAKRNFYITTSKRRPPKVEQLSEICSPILELRSCTTAQEKEGYPESICSATNKSGMVPVFNSRTIPTRITSRSNQNNYNRENLVYRELPPKRHNPSNCIPIKPLAGRSNHFVPSVLLSNTICLWHLKLIKLELSFWSLALTWCA